MQAATPIIVLTASQAACLDAIKDGAHAKTMIAIKAKLDLRPATAALKKLQHSRLVRNSARYGWRATKRGRSCCVEVIPGPERHLGGKAFDRVVAGSNAERLFKILDRPMRISELAELSGISRQGVHQLVVKMLASGQLRTLEDAKAFRLVARIDDPTILLTQNEARILSAMPDQYPTSAAGIRTAARLSADRERAPLASLSAKGLIEDVQRLPGERLCRLTKAGLTHPQRDISAQHAEPLHLKVRSDRVFAVLTLIAETGDVRIKDIGRALDIPNQSMNALIQNLKRKGLVRNVGREFRAPYELTDEGRETLAELVRRRQL